MTSGESSLLIRNAKLLDPANDVDLAGSVLIRDGVIESIGPDIPSVAGVEEIDANGLHLFPAFCDPHVHFRTPGQTEKEDIESGSRAALAGGFTTVIQMPNTDPVIDSPELVMEMTRDEPIDLKVIAAVTIGSKSRELVDFQSLHDAGAVGFSDDGQPVMESVFMKAALIFGNEHGVPVASHAEDPSFGLGGIVRLGMVAESLSVPGWNPKRESEMVRRDAILAKNTGGHVHICHVSVAKSLETIRKAKEKGYNVTAEVTPHHLALTVNDVSDFGADAKMNPPLGIGEDCEALIDALADGTIDCVATDHAPHTPEEKSRGLMKAPFGVIGLETSFAVVYTELVLTGRIKFARLIEAMTSRPRDIFHLEKIGLIEGSRADLVLIDLNGKWTVDPEKFQSKGRNCPFVGQELTGRVIKTIYRGKVLWEFE